MILPEATGTAGACSHINVGIDDVRFAAFLRLGLQEIDQIAGGKRRRTAGPHVDELLAGIQIGAGHVRQGFRLVAHVVKGSLDEPFVLPCQTAKQHGDVVSLGSRK
jgi:hypothetical protein